MWRLVLPFCGVVWAASASSSHAAPSSATEFIIGSRRTAIKGRSLFATALRDFEHEADSFSFEGPVAGLGFVTHRHDVVFKNTTAWLDDYRDVLAQASCLAFHSSTPIADRRADGNDSENPGAADVHVPGLSDTTARRGIQLHLQLKSALEGGKILAQAFVHRLSTADILLVGVDALPLLQRDAACTDLMGSASPVFRVAAFRTSHGDTRAGGTGAITAVDIDLAPAGLLEPFMAASWRHRVEPNIDSALAARGLAWSDYSSHDSQPEVAGRSLSSFPLVSLNVNREGDGPAGRIVDPSVTLKNWTTLRLSCENCSAYLTVTLDVELDFCVWGSFLMFHGRVGFGCDARDRKEKGTGFRVHFLSRVTVEAGVGVGLRLATAGDDGTLTYDHTIERSRLLYRNGPSFSFSIWGLPIQVRAHRGNALAHKPSAGAYTVEDVRRCAASDRPADMAALPAAPAVAHASRDSDHLGPRLRTRAHRFFLACIVAACRLALALAWTTALASTEHSRLVWMRAPRVRLVIPQGFRTPTATTRTCKPFRNGARKRW